MSERLLCYRCSAALDALTPPLSRRDMCPDCSAELHVCRMCRHFSEQALQQCLEEDAEEVREKEKANFCEWFVASPEAYDPEHAGDARRAEAELASLFGEADTASSAENSTSPADDLFK